jgi:hypothetical protein
MPTEPSSRRGSRASGDDVLARSLLLPLATLAPGGVKPLKVPRASVTVLMPPSSPCVLLSILAAASELLNRAGRCGRRLRDEKKSGDGGSTLGRNDASIAKLKLSSDRRAKPCRRRRLWRGSLTGSCECARVTSADAGSSRFVPATAGGVFGGGRELCSRSEAPRSSGRAGVHGDCGRSSDGGVSFWLSWCGFDVELLEKMDGGGGSGWGMPGCRVENRRSRATVSVSWSRRRQARARTAGSRSIAMSPRWR